MNSKKYKITIALVVALILLATGLFIFDNFYLAQKERQNLVEIYVAKDDIQAYTKITEDMFKRIAINRDSVIPSYVTNVKEVAGQELMGAILKGEPLTSVRLSKESLRDEGQFSLKIEPDFVGDVQQEDLVRVYVQLTDRNTKESQMKVLFDAKKVKKITSADNVILTGSQGVKVANVHINATEQELQDYYIAKQKGLIIVAKYDVLDINEVETKAKDTEMENKFDANSDIVENSSRPTEENEEGISVMSYVVQAGETIDSLSIKFKTDIETISNLNEGREVFEAGETIIVPAE